MVQWDVKCHCLVLTCRKEVIFILKIDWFLIDHTDCDIASRVSSNPVENHNVVTIIIASILLGAHICIHKSIYMYIIYYIRIYIHAVFRNINLEVKDPRIHKDLPGSREIYLVKMSKLFAIIVNFYIQTFRSAQDSLHY